MLTEPTFCEVAACTNAVVASCELLVPSAAVAAVGTPPRFGEPAKADCTNAVVAKFVLLSPKDCVVPVCDEPPSSTAVTTLPVRVAVNAGVADVTASLYASSTIK